MRCLNFTCTREASGRFPCCDSICGYTYKANMGQMEKYQNGIIGWRYLKIGLMHYFSLEECEYYNRKLTEKQNGKATNYKHKVLE